jgi:hypothetical protein
VKNAVLRKLIAFANRMPRAVRRIASAANAYDRRPPVLCNSFPKSGTHLLSQILGAIAMPREYGTFIASMPSITYRERSAGSIRRSIAAIAPGEMVRAHLHYSDDTAKWIEGRNLLHFFIYRDPRDVVISEAFYLSDMNRWHRLHRHFAGLETVRERVLFSILGNEYRATPYDYPDIGARYRRYQPWINHPTTCAIRFEDLRGDRPDLPVSQVARFYCESMNATGSVSDITASALASVDSGRSHTFRRGTAGQWKELFDGEHRDALKRVAGGLLVELGYESDTAW